MTPYPFGSDGNAVDLSSGKCGSLQLRPPGAGWSGDFNSDAQGPGQLPPCYLQATSMAFRAWNRGLAATQVPPGQGNNGANTWEPLNAFGVWLYNGTRWFPDPTFPGAATCPGSTVLWAGKLDYWLVGKGEGDRTTTNGQTLCRFDGVNFQWEVLKLPAATMARFPVDPNTFVPQGGVSAGACYAWNNCWFFGDDGATVHWDGNTLTDASLGLGPSPWLSGDFTAAVGRTDPGGSQFGFAVTKSSSYTTTSNPAFNGAAVQPLPARPDGSPPPQLFGSSGAAFAPLPLSPPGARYSGDPFTTDLAAVDFNPSGDGWAAGIPAPRESSHAPAPLIRLSEDGSAAACAGYDGSTFSGDTFQWTGVSVFPTDGSALAGGYRAKSFTDPHIHQEPVLVHAACGSPPVNTVFEIPDPRAANQATAPPVPADASGATPETGGGEFSGQAGQGLALAANAVNDAWASTSFGVLVNSDPSAAPYYERPHVYRFSDGLKPDAPAGDDRESRPSLFTLDPPVYVQPPPVVVVQQVQNVVTRKAKPKHKKVLPAIYDVTTRLTRARSGTFSLYIMFKLRRAVTVGAVGLRGRSVVARSGLKRFRGKSGQLALTLDPRRPPTAIEFVSPPPSKK